jgi:hypothetical protein
MMYSEQKTAQEEQETALEEQEIGLLRELLLRIDGECRAYIKGAVKALLYAQEEPQQIGNKPNRAFSYTTHQTKEYST